MTVGQIVRLKLILAIVGGLLFCTLSTLEVPELLKLADDTSNDFSLTTVHETVPPASELDTTRSESSLGQAISAVPRKSTVWLQSPSVKPSADDILHSFCILRT